MLAYYLCYYTKPIPRPTEYAPTRILVKGAKGFAVDTTTSRFKVLGHGVERFTSFYDEDGMNFTPDTINLSLGEFTWLGWDGDAEVFADFVAEGENPVDCVKLLLTDPDKGANLPLADLDTSSTGKRGSRSLSLICSTGAMRAGSIWFPI